MGLGRVWIEKLCNMVIFNQFAIFNTYENRHHKIA
jgi:hypothetical protein